MLSESSSVGFVSTAVVGGPTEKRRFKRKGGWGTKMACAFGGHSAASRFNGIPQNGAETLLSFSVEILQTNATVCTRVKTINLSQTP